MTRFKTFPYYGGKYVHLGWLLPLLPHTDQYCEPYGGSAVVLINRSPSNVETYNDLYGEAVHFLRTLRDMGPDLISKIALTPYSREEYNIAISEPEGDIDPIERARRFFVRARQVRAGKAARPTPYQWGYSVAHSRRGMAGRVSAWNHSPKDLELTAKRLLRVQIEQEPALDAIRRYDHEGTLFYCDPPYPIGSREGSSRSVYRFEMSDEDHEELAAALNGAKGLVAISGYECDLMNDLYRDWDSRSRKTRSSTSPTRGERVEVLWANYDLSALSAMKRSSPHQEQRSQLSDPGDIARQLEFADIAHKSRMVVR